MISMKSDKATAPITTTASIFFRFSHEYGRVFVPATIFIKSWCR